MNPIFLFYSSRSGSTLLARKLSDYASNYITVLPEFRLVGILANEGDDKVRSLEPEQLYRLFLLDTQLLGMGFSTEDLTLIAKQTVGKGIRVIIDTVIAYCMQILAVPTTDTVFIKHGELLFLYEKLYAIWPDAKFIHLVRDGRAVANSLLQIDMPYFPYGNMGRNDIVFCANYWRKCLEIVSQDCKVEDYNILTIYYEKLNQDESSVLNQLSEFLNIPLSTQNDNSAEYFINDLETELHKNVNSPVISSRMDAWRFELKSWQGITFEQIASSQLEYNGYQNWFLPSSSRFKILSSIAFAYFLHLVNLVIFIIRILFFYITSHEYRYRINKRVQTNIKRLFVNISTSS